MKKLKLDLDRIQVESFAAEAAERVQGTVQAHSADPRFGCETAETCRSCRACEDEPTAWDHDC